MFTIEEVAALLEDSAAKLPHITGKPTGDDLERLRKILINLLQAVKLPGGNYVKGLITTEANYNAARTGRNFDHLDTLFKAYDPAIFSNAMTTNCMRAEREWTAKLLRQRLLFGR